MYPFCAVCVRFTVRRTLRTLPAVGGARARARLSRACRAVLFPGSGGAECCCCCVRRWRVRHRGAARFRRSRTEDSTEDSSEDRTEDRTEDRRGECGEMTAGVGCGTRSSLVSQSRGDVDVLTSCCDVLPR